MPALRRLAAPAAALALVIPTLALAAACSSSSSSSGSDPGDGGDPDAGPTVTCDKDPRVDTYVANLSKTSASGMKVTLVSADPAPPIRGTNAWTVKVTDASGAPVTNAALTITPFMPDHGHGTSIKATATPQPDGTYQIKPLYLFMPGVWRITIAMPASGDAGAGDSVEFFFCVAG